MIKKLLILIAFMCVVPLEILANTYVTINQENVPIQETYSSLKVIALIPNGEVVEKTSINGEMYAVKYGKVEGWINRAYTVEGEKEIAAQSSTGSSTLTANSTFAEVAAERKRYVRDHDYYYSQSGPIVPANYKKTRTVDCSSYVSDVIWHYADLKNNSGMKTLGRMASIHFNGRGDKLKAGKTDPYFIRLSSNDKIMPGDILCYPGHVEIYAGGSSGSRPKVYNCGSDNAIQSSNIITTSGKSFDAIKHILRVK